MKNTIKYVPNKSKWVSGFKGVDQSSHKFQKHSLLTLQRLVNALRIPFGKGKSYSLALYKTWFSPKIGLKKRKQIGKKVSSNLTYQLAKEEGWISFRRSDEAIKRSYLDELVAKTRLLYLNGSRIDKITKSVTFKRDIKIISGAESSGSGSSTFNGTSLPLLPDVRSMSIIKGLRNLNYSLFGISKYNKETSITILEKGPNHRENRYLKYQYTRLLKSIYALPSLNEKGESIKVSWNIDFLNQRYNLKHLGSNSHGIQMALKLANQEPKEKYENWNPDFRPTVKSLNWFKTLLRIKYCDLAFWNLKSYKGDTERSTVWTKFSPDYVTNQAFQQSIPRKEQPGRVHLGVVDIDQSYLPKLTPKRLKAMSSHYWLLAHNLLRYSKTYQVALFCALNRDQKWYTHATMLKIIPLLGTIKTALRNWYQQVVMRRVWIQSPPGKHRPLGVSTRSWRVILKGDQILLETFIKGSPDENQHAYIKGRGTATAWRTILYEGILKFPYIYEYDFRGFFDNIKLEHVAKLLKKYGIPKHVSLRYMLLSGSNVTPPLTEDVAPLIKEETFGKAYSKEFIYDYRKDYRYCGLPQGSGISPLLSILCLKMLNGLEKSEKPIYNLKYADDGLFYSMHPLDPIEEVKKSDFCKLTGCEFVPEKSGWVKQDGIWLKPLKFVGLVYDGNKKELSAHTRGNPDAKKNTPKEFREGVKNFEKLLANAASPKIDNQNFAEIKRKAATKSLTLVDNRATLEENISPKLFNVQLSRLSPFLKFMATFLNSLLANLTIETAATLKVRNQPTPIQSSSNKTFKEMTEATHSSAELNFNPNPQITAEGSGTLLTYLFALIGWLVLWTSLFLTSLLFKCISSYYTDLNKKDFTKVKEKIPIKNSPQQKTEEIDPEKLKEEILAPPLGSRLVLNLKEYISFPSSISSQQLKSAMADSESGNTILHPLILNGIVQDSEFYSFFKEYRSYYKTINPGYKIVPYKEGNFNQECEIFYDKKAMLKYNESLKGIHYEVWKKITPRTNVFEKEFLLNYENISITKHVHPFIEMGGQFEDVASEIMVKTNGMTNLVSIPLTKINPLSEKLLSVSRVVDKIKITLFILILMLPLTYIIDLYTNYFLFFLMVYLILLVYQNTKQNKLLNRKYYVMQLDIGSSNPRDFNFLMSCLYNDTFNLGSDVEQDFSLILSEKESIIRLSYGKFNKFERGKKGEMVKKRFNTKENLKKSLEGESLSFINASSISSNLLLKYVNDLRIPVQTSESDFGPRDTWIKPYSRLFYLLRNRRPGPSIIKPWAPELMNRHERAEEWKNRMEKGKVESEEQGGLAQTPWLLANTKSPLSSGGLSASLGILKTTVPKFKPNYFFEVLSNTNKFAVSSFEALNCMPVDKKVKALGKEETQAPSVADEINNLVPEFTRPYLYDPYQVHPRTGEKRPPNTKVLVGKKGKYEIELRDKSDIIRLLRYDVSVNRKLLELLKEGVPWESVYNMFYSDHDRYWKTTTREILMRKYGVQRQWLHGKWQKRIRDHNRLLTVIKPTKSDWLTWAPKKEECGAQPKCESKYQVSVSKFRRIFF